MSAATSQAAWDKLRRENAELRAERDELAAQVEAKIDAMSDSIWTPGYPKHPWDKEWFIAMTTYGDRVVLTALPEEYTYDFKTADETYMKKESIKAWMQFLDSEYVDPRTETEEIHG